MIVVNMNIELTPEQLFAYLKDELIEGRVASAENPDGIYYSVEEKQKIVEYYEKNRIFNK